MLPSHDFDWVFRIKYPCVFGDDITKWSSLFGVFLHSVKARVIGENLTVSPILRLALRVQWNINGSEQRQHRSLKVTFTITRACPTIAKDTQLSRFERFAFRVELRNEIIEIW